MTSRSEAPIDRTIGRCALKPMVAIAAAALLAAVLASPARADVVYTFDTSVNGSSTQSGTAQFTFTGANAFTLTLSNLGNVTGIASVLDGLTFTEAGATSLQLNSISALAKVTCTSTPTKGCSDSTPSSYSGDWTASISSGAVAMSAGPTGYKPYGIVNDSIDSNCATTNACSGMNGDLSNSKHNPYLMGPVTFAFTTDGETSIPVISDLVFLFGTTPDKIDGTCTSANGCSPSTTVPEPTTLALFGAGLAALGFALHRRRKAI